MATSVLPRPMSFTPQLISGGDLNDYKTPGFYTWTNAGANMPANSPVAVQSFMAVFYTAGTMPVGTRLFQIVFPYSTNYRGVYYRWFYESAGWTSWVKLVEPSDLSGYEKKLKRVEVSNITGNMAFPSGVTINNIVNVFVKGNANILAKPFYYELSGGSGTIVRSGIKLYLINADGTISEMSSSSGSTDTLVIIYEDS